MPSPKALFHALVDLLFGFDFFISYAQADGLNYPKQLTRRLEVLGFKVFLDTRVYVAGDDLQIATRRRLRMSKKLVVVARPRALSSHWVAKEVEECLRAGRTPIVIDVNGTIEGSDAASGIKQRLADKLQIRENLPEVDAAPSEATLMALVKSFDATRQDVLRRRVVGAAAVVLAVLASVAVWQALVALVAQGEAERQRDIAVARELATRSQLVRLQSPGRVGESLGLAIDSLQRTQAMGIPSPNAKQIFRAAVDRIARPLVALDEEAELTFAAFSPDASHLAVARSDGVVGIWRSGAWVRSGAVRHQEAVIQVRFSSDGQRLLSIDPEEIVVTQVRGMTELRRISNTSDVRQAFFGSGDESLLLQMLVPGPPDGSPREPRWRLEHQTSAGQPQAESLATNAQFVAVSADGETHAWHSGEATRVKRLGTQQEPFVAPIPDEDYRVLGIDLSPGGGWLAQTYIYDGEQVGVEVFDTRRASDPPRQFRLGYMVNARLSSFANDAALAVQAGDNVYVLEVRANRPLTKRATIPAADAERILLSPDGEHLAVQTRDRVRLWNLRDPEHSRWLLHPNSVGNMAFSGRSGWLVTTSGHTAFAWNIYRDWQPEGSQGGEPAGHLSRDGAYEIRRRLGQLKVYPAGGSRALATLGGPDLGTARWHLLVAPGSNLAAAGNVDEPMRLWSLPDGKPIQVPSGLRGEPLAFSADGHYLATQEETPDGDSIAIWDLRAGDIQARWLGEEGPWDMPTFTLADRGKFLLAQRTGRFQPDYWLWDPVRNQVFRSAGGSIQTLGASAWIVGEEAVTLHREDANVRLELLGGGRALGSIETSATGFALGLEGRWLAASSGSEIELWAVPELTLRATLLLPEPARALGFSNDGDYLAAITDGSIDVWQLDTGGILVDRIRHQGSRGDRELGYMGSVAFSEDDRMLFALYLDGEAERVWYWRTPDLIAEVCTYVPNLDCWGADRISLPKSNKAGGPLAPENSLKD